MRPIDDRPEDGFWPATMAVFDRTEATELVEQAFPFTGPLRRHRDAIVFATRLDPRDAIGGPFPSDLPGVRIEYIDEAIRAVRRAERQGIHESGGEIRDRFELNRPGRPDTSMTSPRDDPGRQTTFAAQRRRRGR